MPSIFEQFGEIDIYLFDQILRGRIAPGMRIFDAGCGYGRNLVYFLRERYAVYGADEDPEAVTFCSEHGRAVQSAAPAHELSRRKLGEA